ncbi:MAG: ABC transporter ATP-binding protein [Burkholderiaceae bacterium]
MVEIENLWLTYGGATQASVQGVSLHIAAGEFFTLLGPSGCGKTSTLRSVAGLEAPTQGRIAISGAAVFDARQGRNVPTHARDIAMVFQSYAIWPHMTVGQNVAFPLEVMKRPRDEIRRRVAEALDMVGLADYLQRDATQLSGGQQQRVAIARALVRRAAVMLLDEPLSNLDAKLREQMRVELRDLLKRVGMTAIYVTHDQEEALMLSDRIALMRGGRLVEVGAPRELYLAPTTEFGASFLGAAEIFRVLQRNGARLDTEVGPLELSTTPTEKIRSVAIRPEAIQVWQDAAPASAGVNRLSGRLEGVVFSGRQQQLTVSLAGGRRLQVLADAMRAFRPGEPVHLELPSERLMTLYQESAPD